MTPLRIVPIALAAVISIAAAAAAESEKSAAPQIELIDVFTHTGQALVYDQVEAQYVLLRTGSRLRGFNVGSIKDSQIELFRAKNARLRFVVTKAAQTGNATGNASGNASGTLIDPYGTSGQASSGQTASGQRASTGGPIAVPAEPIATTEADAPPPPLKRVRAPAKSRPDASPTRAIVTRKELNRALDDLDSLSREVELELVAGGTRVKAIGKGTLPYRLGLRPGDVIVSVAGIKTTRLEDGADVFVRLSSAKKFTIKVLRDSKPVSVTIIVQARPPSR